MPEQGNLIDIPIDEVEGIKIIARFRVIKRDEKRDLYLMQVIDVRQERLEDENSKES
jgi:hypothetical protein